MSLNFQPGKKPNKKVLLKNDEDIQKLQQLRIDGKKVKVINNTMQVVDPKTNKIIDSFDNTSQTTVGTNSVISNSHLNNKNHNHKLKNTNTISLTTIRASNISIVNRMKRIEVEFDVDSTYGFGIALRQYKPGLPVFVDKMKKGKYHNIYIYIIK